MSETERTFPSDDEFPTDLARTRPAPPGRRPHRRGLFLAATIIDALGSGLWMPFALLFLVHAQGFGLVESGAALSGGALVGLAGGPVLGSIMDRVGAATMLLASNMVRALAFACYPLVTAVPHIVVVAAVVSIGDRLFWTANAPMITSLTEGRASERLLGIQTVARFAGSGLGAGGSALLPTMTITAFHLIAYLNAASFVLAAVLIWLVRPTRRERVQASSAAPVRGSWATVLRDRPYVAFCGVTVLFTLASVGKYSMLPILVTDVLHGPQWVFGTAMAIGTVVMVAGQQPILRFVGRWTRVRGMVTAAGIFACSFATLIPASLVPVGAAVILILGTAVLSAIAEAIFAPLMTAAAAAAAPQGAEGRASALFQLSWAASQVAGPALLTSLLSAGNAVLWLTLTVTSVCAIPAVALLSRRLPHGALAR
ncbi:MFS transporter [Amycolatopsis taiwanensis]|uniref:MFS transporter n=1 Tax=Amycolatopsis taiwanensis TaxID=342230 RepID=UPI0004B331BA|nr:MFS transporter [Amycolatopsis taiwanensis]